LRITILGKPRCVLLHFECSKHCVCPLYKFLYAFKIGKPLFEAPYIFNKMQYYNIYFIWKPFSMFRVIPFPITSSDNSYLQHLYPLYERSNLGNFGIYEQSVISHNAYLNRNHCDTQKPRMLRIVKKVYIFGKTISEVCPFV
jgi:hypothetical protein